MATLEAGVHEAALSDGTSAAPVACAFDASVPEAVLGIPAVPTAGAQKACTGDGAGGGGSALVASVHVAVPSNGVSVAQLDGAHEVAHGLSAVPTAGAHMVGAGDSAGALKAIVHEIAIDAPMAGARVGTGTFKAVALETAPRDGVTLAPLACVLAAGACEAALGIPAVPIACA